MSVIGAAIAGGIGAAGSIGGALINSSAAGSAADKQAAAARYATDIQNQQYQQTRADQEPWRQAGAGAISQLGNPDFQKSFSMQDFQQDPGYQFRMQQGQQALERSAAARGGLMSGGFAKALSDYGQNSASQEYQNAYNRFNNDQSTRFNRLSSIAGFGQTANAQLGQAGANFADNAGSIAMQNAKNQGSAGIAQGNAFSGAISSIGNQAPDAYWMNRMYPGSPPPSTPALSSMSGPTLGNYSSGGGSFFDGPNPYSG